MGNTNSTEGNNSVSSTNNNSQQLLQQHLQQQQQQQQRRRSRSNSSTSIPSQPSPSTSSSIDKRIKVEKSPEPIPVVVNSHQQHHWSPTEPSIQEDLSSTTTTNSRMDPKQIPIIMKDNEPLSSSSTTTTTNETTPPKPVPVSTGKKSGWVSSTGAASPWYGSLSSSTSSSHHRASISGPYYRTRGMSVTRDNENDEDLSSIISNTSSTLTAQPPKPNTFSSHNQGVPTIITWTQGGNNVFVTGTFNGWKHKIKLIKSTHDFNAVLELPPGTHRLKFIVDDEWKCSNEMETATDPDGNLVNYLQVMDEEEDGENDDFGEVSTVSSSGSLHEDGKKYSNVIPPELLQLAAAVNNAAEEEEGQKKNILADWEKKQPQPPTLPPHLEKVLLNSNTVSEEDNSVLYEPNHVTLNHLYACSIKDNVMALATTSRYRKKYVTTMYYRPVFPKN